MKGAKQRKSKTQTAVVIVMSWWNPSQNEAADEYYASKSRYNQAANQRYASQRAEANYRSQRAQSMDKISECRSDKLNFERRVKDIAAIIGALEGTGHLFSADVPGTISSYNKSGETASNSFRDSIKNSDVPAANLAEIFRGKSVEEDANSSAALNEYKAEKARLEQALRDLENQINSLRNSVDTLTRQISACNIEQIHLRRVMVTSAFDMSHFRRFM